MLWNCLDYYTLSSSTLANHLSLSSSMMHFLGLLDMSEACITLQVASIINAKGTTDMVQSTIRLSNGSRPVYTYSS